jgi:ABC-type polysaccharide/polyol phosphate transport system ATPase subunit
MPVIEVNNLIKEYHLGAMQGLKQTLLNTAARLTGKKVEERPLFKALDDVSFSIEPGEVVGIIGHNGAGKSTLLKMLAKISTPTHGSVKVEGRIAPLIEVGAGFVPDFTGRENVYLNGTILGMSRQEIDEKFDEIVDFAEMAEFIDTPVKRYSSGMQVKLAFAVATSVEAEILIVDEVLAVGDLAFQRKCFDRMEDMIKRQGKTVLLVSHNIRQVDRLCSRVILLDHGHIIADAEPHEVCNLFYERSNNKIASQLKESSQNLAMTDDVDSVVVRILDERQEVTDRLHCLRPMTIRVQLNVRKPLSNVCCLIATHTTDFVYITANDSVNQPRDYEVGLHTIDLEVSSLILLPGTYSMRFWIGRPDGKVSFSGENLCTFQVVSDNYFVSRLRESGLVFLEAEWQFSKGLRPRRPPSLSST